MLNDRYLSELDSSWLNQHSHTSFDPTRSRQIVPTTTDLTNASGPLAIYRPQINYNDRQHPKHEPGPSETKQNNIVQLIGTANKSKLIQIVIGTMIGLVICGVPLAVISALYVQAKASNSASSSSSGGSSTSLPSQCSSYTTAFDTTRNSGYTTCSGCYCDSSMTTGWYRFVGSGGTALITSPVSTGLCGTTNTGWFNGTFPSTAGGTTYGIVCVNYSGNLCYASYSVSSVGVTNCNGFYVFYLTPMPNCNSRYCIS